MYDVLHRPSIYTKLNFKFYDEQFREFKYCVIT